MKTQEPKTEVKPRPLSRYAAHAGETETWIDVAAPSCTEAEKLHAVYSAAPDLLAKLQRLLGVAELNVDDMEPETRAAVREASALCAELE